MEGLVSVTGAPASVVAVLPAVRERVVGVVDAYVANERGPQGSVLPQDWTRRITKGDWGEPLIPWIALRLLGGARIRASLSRLLLSRLWRFGVVRSTHSYCLPGPAVAGLLCAVADDPSARAAWVRLWSTLEPPRAADVAVLRSVDMLPTGCSELDGFLAVCGAWQAMRADRMDVAWPTTPLARDVLTSDFLRGLRRESVRRAGARLVGNERTLPPVLRWGGEPPAPEGLMAMALSWCDRLRRKARAASLAALEPLRGETDALLEGCTRSALLAWQRTLFAEGREEEFLS